MDAGYNASGQKYRDTKHTHEGRGRVFGGVCKQMPTANDGRMKELVVRLEEAMHGTAHTTVHKPRQTCMISKNEGAKSLQDIECKGPSGDISMQAGETGIELNASGTNTGINNVNRHWQANNRGTVKKGSIQPQKQSQAQKTANVISNRLTEKCSWRHKIFPQFWAQFCRQTICCANHTPTHQLRATGGSSERRHVCTHTMDNKCTDRGLGGTDGMRGQKFS